MRARCKCTYLHNNIIYCYPLSIEKRSPLLSQTCGDPNREYTESVRVLDTKGLTGVTCITLNYVLGHNARKTYINVMIFYLYELGRITNLSDGLFYAEGVRNAFMVAWVR